MVLNVAAEKRRWARSKLSLTVRMRPSLPIAADFDEVLATSNCSRKGCYFTTPSLRYKNHLRLFIVFPYSDVRGAINRDYLGEIVRVENLPDGRKGVAVNLVTPIGLSETSPS